MRPNHRYPRARVPALASHPWLPYSPLSRACLWAHAVSWSVRPLRSPSPLFRYGLTDVPKDSCFLRSRPYLDLIEKTMSQLVQWGAVSASPVAAAAAAAGPGAGARVQAAAVPKAPTSGFGGGGATGGAAAGKKGGGGAKKKKSKKR